MLFDSIGFVEFLVLVVIALVVFGPERLPEAAKKAASMIRQLRRMANNARNDLSEELGPEFRDMDLNDIRNPRRAVQRYVLDGVDEDDVRVDKDLDLRKDLEEFDRDRDGNRRSGERSGSRTGRSSSRTGQSNDTDPNDTRSDDEAPSPSGSSGGAPSDTGGSEDPEAGDRDGALALRTDERPPFDPEAT